MMAGYLECPVCRDIFKDPVILTCSHSFCETCISHYWVNKPTQECPVCRTVLQGELLRNLALKNLSESKMDENDVLRCSIHSERLSLFCKTDGQLACWVCQQAKQHIRHRFCPLEEAIPECRGKVENLLQTMRNKLRAFEKAKTTSHNINETIKAQAHNTERQIKQEFEKLHEFLRDEEVARIAKLKEEEEQKTQIMKEKIEKMNREMSFLSQRIQDIEEKMKMDGISFLKEYTATIERARCTVQYPERFSGTLINVADHLGNLKFIIWEKMQSLVKFTPVTLDPNTANPHLVISEDLTSVEYRQQPLPLPDNSERFDHYPCVLGSEGFNSGVHCWEVEVGDSPHWELGVMAESGQRKGEPNNNVTMRWIVCCSEDKYVARFGWANDPLNWLFGQSDFIINVTHKPKTVRVTLDLDQECVLFTDPDKKICLSKLHLSLGETFFPYFKIETGMKVLASRPANEQ